MPIKITNFGGLHPKASPRALPSDGAQIAKDLQPGNREFRPLGQDTQVVASSGVTNPKTIYRFQHKSDGTFNTDMTTGWIVKAIEMSFVKGQINDDTTERTFATSDDGSNPPWVYDATDTVTGRRLGVPAPTDAPTLVVNRVAQFSTDDRAAAVKAASDYFKTLANDATMLVPTWFGAATTTQSDFRPGTTHDGYVDRVTVPTLNADPSQQLRVFRLDSTGGADNGGISNTYDSFDAASYQWVMDPSLAGFYQTSPSSAPLWPTWAGTNNDHWCVPFTAYAIAYEPQWGRPSCGARQRWKCPARTREPRSFRTPMDEVMTRWLSTRARSGRQARRTSQPLKAEVDAMHVMLGGGGTEQRAASIAAFYALSRM
jgi:hypothetical protein